MSEEWDEIENEDDQDWCENKEGSRHGWFYNWFDDGWFSDDDGWEEVSRTDGQSWSEA